MDEVVLSLGTSPRDFIKKAIPGRLTKEDSTIEDLINYGADPAGDEINPPYQDDLEKATAGRIRSFLRDIKRNPHSSTLSVRYFKGNGELSDPLPLEGRVPDYLGEMIVPQETITQEGARQYYEAKMMVQHNPGGGVYV